MLAEASTRNQSIHSFLASNQYSQLACRWADVSCAVTGRYTKEPGLKTVMGREEGCLQGFSNAEGASRAAESSVSQVVVVHKGLWFTSWFVLHKILHAQ